MNEEPLFIRISSEKLFTIIHRPSLEKIKGLFVFCHPFAEEKLWSHRVYVSFARALAIKGFLTARFDLRGYGDSDGDFVEISVDQHLEDIKSVLGHVRQNYPEINIIGLLGLRLGATLAVLSAQQNPEVNRLLLWDPVINGDRYMQDILRSNLAAQMSEKGRVEIAREDLVNDMKSGNPVNVEGYPLTYRMFQQVSAINLHEINSSQPVSCLINQVVKNIKQPVSKDLIKLQDKFDQCHVTKSEELPFWKEINEFYYDAKNLFESSLTWVDGNEN